MGLVSRKGIEACHRLKAFDAEFDTWLDTSKDGAEFQRHGSQIRALKSMLKAFHGSLAEPMSCDAKPPATPPLETSTDASRLALALFGIWDFFRVKLDQRRNPGYARALRQADELAWLCYRPARDLGLKEPPLVFFNGGTSPFILRRNTRFYADGVPAELATDESILEATSKLPFPVIGVPWTQVSYAPDAVVIAHEVGHAIEIDLALKDDLDAAIDGALGTAGQGRAGHWKQWRSEIFADLYGCLSLGPSFGRTVRDFLAAPKDVIVSELPSASSSYPPASARVRFLAAALEGLGFADDLWPDWQQIYDSVADAAAPFVDDAPAVAKALSTTPLERLAKQPITSLIGFTPEQATLADKLAAKAAARENVPATSDVRALFAAVRLAYDADPDGCTRREVTPGGVPVASTLDRLLERIDANVADVYRADEGVYSQARDKQHRDRGVEWAKSLRASVWSNPKV
jgi:hypothetical protein